MEETQAVLLPFYVLVDVSWSMTAPLSESATGASNGDDRSTGIDAVNAIAPETADLFDRSPVLRDKVRFGLVDFAGSAEVRIPLCDVATLGTIPQLTARQDGTAYASAFSTMRSQIESDVVQLKVDRYKVHRPAVFFLTDGEPTDSANEWQATFKELIDPGFRARPNFVPYGIGDANKAVLDQLAYYKTTGKAPAKSFMAAPGVSAADAISSMIEMLLASILQSGEDLAEKGSDGGWVPPSTDDDDDIWI